MDNSDFCEQYNVTLYKLKSNYIHLYIIKILFTSEFNIYVKYGKQNGTDNIEKTTKCIDKEDAILQFNKIFISKTDNEYSNNLTNFIEKEDKYSIHFPEKEHNHIINAKQNVNDKYIG